jgi:hypothetical protein
MGSREDDAYWNDKYAEPVENKYRIILGVTLGRAKEEDDYSLEEFGCSDQEWDEMDEKAREKFIDDAVKDHVWNNIDSWGKVTTDG